MQTVKVELGGGDYAVLLKEIRHKTTKFVREVVMKYQKPPEKPLTAAEVIATPELLKKEIDFSKVDMSEIQELTILNQLTELSLDGVIYIQPENAKPFEPTKLISQRVMNDMSTSKYDLLSAEVDKLYGGNPLPVMT
jgi:hypothetical protein